MSKLIKSILVLITIFISTNNFAQDKGDGFYETKEKGWWWKEVEPLLKEELEEPPPVELKKQTQAEPLEGVEFQETAKAEPVPEGPTPLSPAWLRENLPKFRDRAIDNASPENLRAYFYLQRYAMDKAETFAYASQKIVINDPILDANIRRPISTYGSRAVDDAARKKMNELALRLAGEAGIWYFYRSDCPYCEKQNPVLKRLEKRLGLAILPIALDNKPMPDGMFPEFVSDNGHASTLGISVTPSIIMVKKPDQFVMVSAGLVTDNEFIKRMIEGAKKAEWITDKEYKETRKVKRAELVDNRKGLSEELLNNPVELVKYLKNEVYGSN